MCSETTMTLHVAYAPRSVDYFQYRKAGQLWNQGTSKGTNGLLTDRSNRQSILSKRLSLLLSRLLRKDTPRQRDDDLHDDPPYRHIADFHATWNDQKYFFPNRFKPDIDRYGQTRNLRNSFLTTRFQASPRNRRRPTDVAGAKMMNRISEYHLPRMGTFHEIKVSAEPRIDLLQIILLRNQRILAFLDTLQQTKKQSLQYYSQTKPQAEQDGTANQHPLVTDTVGHFLPLNNSEKNVSEGVEKHMTTQTNDLGRSQGHFASAKIGRNDQHRSSLSPLLSSPLVEAHNQGGFVEMDTLGTFGALDVDNPASPQGHRLVDHPDPAGGSWGAFDDVSYILYHILCYTFFEHMLFFINSFLLLLRKKSEQTTLLWLCFYFLNL